MQQSVAAGGIGGDRKIVACRIGERDVGVLLDAEVAAGRRYAIEGGRENVLPLTVIVPSFSIAPPFAMP